MTTGPFTASIEGWVAEERELLLAVVQSSAQDIVREIKRPIRDGGNMPVDTSFLQQSLQASTESAPEIDPTHDGSQGPSSANAAAIEAVIAGLEIGQTIYFGFTAVYALRQNYGFYGVDTLGRAYSQPGRYFVEHAMAKWPQIVENNQRRLAANIVF